MPEPAITGVLRTSVQEMKIGDYIVWKVNATTGEYEMDNSTVGYTEMPVGGIAGGTTSRGYYWYGIKVDKGLIVSDRVRNHTISWDSLNTSKSIEGAPYRILSGGVLVDGVQRCLTGGVAYADNNGNGSLSYISDNGAFPSNNEWDTYIKRSDLNGKATPNDDNVWHHKNIFTVVQETSLIGTWKNKSGGTQATTSSWRVCRGFDLRTGSDWKDITITTTTDASAIVGFRPVFEYNE